MVRIETQYRTLALSRLQHLKLTSLCVVANQILKRGIVETDGPLFHQFSFRGYTWDGYSPVFPVIAFHISVTIKA